MIVVGILVTLAALVLAAGSAAWGYWQGLIDARRTPVDDAAGYRASLESIELGDGMDAAELRLFARAALVARGDLPSPRDPE